MESGEGEGKGSALVTSQHFFVERKRIGEATSCFCFFLFSVIGIFETPANETKHIYIFIFHLVCMLFVCFEFGLFRFAFLSCSHSFGFCSASLSSGCFFFFISLIMSFTLKLCYVRHEPSDGLCLFRCCMLYAFL